MVGLKIAISDLPDNIKSESSRTYTVKLFTMGLYHPLDGKTNLKYKLLCFLTPNKNIQRKRH